MKHFYGIFPCITDVILHETFVIPVLYDKNVKNSKESLFEDFMLQYDEPIIRVCKPFYIEVNDCNDFKLIGKNIYYSGNDDVSNIIYVINKEILESYIKSILYFENNVSQKIKLCNNLTIQNDCLDIQKIYNRLSFSLITKNQEQSGEENAQSSDS